MKDHISGRVLWYKFIDKKETIADYREGISYLELQMPNTNKELEALNSTLKAKLNLHKGISKERRKVIIQDFLKAHFPCR